MIQEAGGRADLRHRAIIFLTNQEGVNLMQNVRENQIQRTRGKVSKQAQQYELHSLF